MSEAPPAPSLPGYIPAGEKVILSLRPDPAYIVLAPMWTLAALAGLGVLSGWALGRWPELQMGGVSVGRVWLWLAILGLARVAWQAADRWARRYVLTDRRILRVRGVFRRSVVDAPLDRVQHLTVTRLLRERVTGLGTLGFATAGTAWVEAHWLMIARPAERLDVVRRAVEAARGSGDLP
jgi:hypothetical protein